MRHPRQFLLTHPVWDVTEAFARGYNELSKFLLTHPVWDVTVSSKILALTYNISTHTSRVGCDKLSQTMGS